MRRPTGHIRERSPRSWEIRYSLGTDPVTGKRRTIKTSVKGKRETAEKELRRLLKVCLEATLSRDLYDEEPMNLRTMNEDLLPGGLISFERMHANSIVRKLNWLRRPSGRS